MAFKYNTAQQESEERKHFTVGWHAGEIVRFNAKENGAGDPMMILTVKIAPNDDTGDAGKELPGFVNINTNDMSLTLIEALATALDHNLSQEWGEREIDVPFLIGNPLQGTPGWGEGLIGELLEVNVMPMKPKPGQATMFAVQGYRRLDAAQLTNVPADLADLV